MINGKNSNINFYVPIQDNKITKFEGGYNKSVIDDFMW